jgi:glutamine synthetase
MNLAAKADRVARKDPGRLRDARMKYLTDEKRIKAVTVCFTDLEGRCTCSTTTRSSCSSRPTT